MTAMINVRNLTVEKRGATICSIDLLEVPPRQRIGIIGPNGCGKSTLLRVLAGLEKKFNGTCTVDVPQSERVYVHQNPYLFRGSVVSNVMYGLRIRRLNSTDASDRATKILQKLGIQHLADRDVQNLSGGEKRRVAIARAAILKPQLLLLDEPFAEIDDDGVSRIISLIDELTESTVLISSPTSLSNAKTESELHL